MAALKDELKMAVIEGDLFTSKDADRIAKYDVPVIQINTSGGCHLDAPMTSANRSDEPIAYKDEDAMERLRAIADAFLIHNREIAHRVDDSVLRIAAGAPRFLRRSRGYVPAPIRLAAAETEAPVVLACGAELKNTFCVTKGPLAFLSEHIGDLANQATLASYEDIIVHYEKIFTLQPRLLACDLHPDYLSTGYARQRAAREGLPLTYVQHHHGQGHCLCPAGGRDYCHLR